MISEQFVAILGLNISQFEKGLKKADSKFDSFQQGLAAVGVSLGAMEMVRFVKEQGQLADALTQTAENLGVTTDNLQALQFAAKRANLDSGTLTQVLGRLKLSAAEAADGTGTQAQALKVLGIKAEEFFRLAPDRQMEALAKAYTGASNQAEAFAATGDILGNRVVPRLTGMMKELAEQGLDGVKKSAMDAGVVIGGQLLDDMTRFQRRTEEVQGVLANWGMNIAGAVDKFTTGLGIMAANVDNFFNGIKTDTTALEDTLAKTVEPVAEIATHFKGTKATAEQLNKLAESELKLKEARLDKENKSTPLVAELLRLTVTASKYHKDTKEYVEATVKADAIRVKLAEEHLKHLEEQKKTIEGIYGELGKKQEAEDAAAEALLSTEQKLANAGALRDMFERQIRENKKTGLDTSLLEAYQTEQQYKIEQLILGQAAERRVTEEGLTEEIVKQKVHSGEITANEGVRLETAIKTLGVQKKQTAELERQLKITFQIRGRGDDELSDDVLAEKVKTLKNDLVRRQATALQGGVYTGLDAQYDPLRSFERNQIASVEKELSLRNRVRSLVPSVGESTAKILLGVDAGEFERLLKFVKEQPEAKRTADALERIDSKLKNAGIGTSSTGSFAAQATALFDIKDLLQNRGIRTVQLKSPGG